jgi:hypothetical protein
VTDRGHDGHDHDIDRTGKNHRHLDLESAGQTAARRITTQGGRIESLQHQLDLALGRIGALEDAAARLAVALRASATEHDAVRGTGMADKTHLAISGELADAFAAFADALTEEPGDEAEPEPAGYDPGPEADDEGGMSEYRHQEPKLWR